MVSKPFKRTIKALALLFLLSISQAKGASPGKGSDDFERPPAAVGLHQNGEKMKEAPSTNLLNMPALNKSEIQSDEIKQEAMAIPLEVRAMIAKSPPLTVELGLIANLEKLRSHENAILVFCSTTHSMNGERYENLIRLLHEEMIKTQTEDGRASGQYPNFLEYARIPNKLTVFLSCLEQDALQSSPETLFRLFQIEEGALRTPPNTLVWLIKSAEGGYYLAQYVLSRKIWDWTRRPWDAPSELQPYMTIDAYHRLIRGSAEKGNLLAQMSLARFYLDRFPMNPENVEHINVTEGLRWLKLLAEQTNDLDKRYKAISWIGGLFFMGSVGPDPVYPSLPGRRMANEYTPNNTMEIAVDHAEALRWYQLIPEKNQDCSVVSTLRHIYRLGRGLKIDSEKADHYRSIYTEFCIKS